MIHVEQRALGPLEQHIPALLQRLVDQPAGIGSERNETGRKPLQQLCVLFDGGPLLDPHQLQQPVGATHPVLEEVSRVLQMTQVAQPEAAAAVLVFVGWPDAAARGTDVLALLAGAVQQFVERHHQVSPVRQENPTVGVDPFCSETIELGEKRLRVQDDAVPHDAGGRLVENARGNLLQDELGIPDDDGVTRIGPALVAHDEVGPLGQNVDQLPFALVAPLGADHNHAVGLGIEHGFSVARPTKKPLTGLLHPLVKPRRPLWLCQTVWPPP